MDPQPVTLTSPSGALTATFLPRLGMVCASLTHDGDQLLALRGGPEAYAEKGSTFGIPLLHPWANRLGAWSYPGPAGEVTLDPASPVVHVDGSTGLPSHGLLAASPLWAVTDHSGLQLSAELDFASDPRLLAAFPYPHRLTYRATITDDALDIRLTVEPTGPEPTPIAFGFHPYLTLSGTDRSAWELTLPVRRRAQLDGHSIPTGETTPVAPGALDGPLGDRAFDDSFDRLEPVPPFTVADARRRLTVTFIEGYDLTQVYSPAGAQFICFEPMTAPIDALRSGQGLRFAQPDSSFSAEFSITVS